MAVNKVEINGATVLDLTSDTVTEQSLLKGVIAHNRSGEKLQELWNLLVLAYRHTEQTISQ